MAASSNPQNDFPLEASIPEGAVPLESILCTEELRRRPRRSPDYEKENRALSSFFNFTLASETKMSDSVFVEQSGLKPLS